MGSKFNLATTKVKDNKLGHLVCAVSYKSNQGFGSFGVLKDNKNQRGGGNSEMISTVEVLVQSRGVRGRDGGCGRV